MYANLDGHAGILEALLKHPDVDVNKDNVCILSKLSLFISCVSVLHLQDQGYTALLFACFKGHEKCVELLLSHHADVNVRDKVLAVTYPFTSAFVHITDGQQKVNLT